MPPALPHGASLILLLLTACARTADGGVLDDVVSSGLQRSPNMCQMTYMRPGYLHVALPMERNPGDKVEGRYNLWAYREGLVVPHTAGDEWTQGKLQELQGLPVLFVPGNGGSFRQVRSLAAESARLYRSRRAALELDWFSADFNEELAAFDAQLLEQQTRFAVVALRHLLARYSAARRVIVVGHSMGGVVAQAAVSRLGCLSCIGALLTLATPHAGSPVWGQPAMAEWYKALRRDWINTTTLLGNMHPPVVSISGGERDWQVTRRLSESNHFVVGKNWIVATTESIPGVWLSADHQCILWCNQLVVRVAEALLQSIQPCHLNIQSTVRTLSQTPCTDSADNPAETTQLLSDYFSAARIPTWASGADISATPCDSPIPTHPENPVLLNVQSVIIGNTGLSGRFGTKVKTWRWDLRSMHQEGRDVFALLASIAPCTAFQILAWGLEDSATPIDLTQHATATPTMVPPDKLASLRARASPTWMILLPAEYLRMMRTLELVVKAQDDDLSSSSASFQLMAHFGSQANISHLNMSLANMMQHHSPFTWFANSIQIDQNTALVHKLSLQQPWYLPQGLSLGLEVRADNEPSCIHGPTLLAVGVGAHMELVFARALQSVVPAHFEDPATKSVHAPIASHNHPFELLLWTDPRLVAWTWVVARCVYNVRLRMQWNKLLPHLITTVGPYLPHTTATLALLHLAIVLGCINPTTMSVFAGLVSVLAWAIQSLRTSMLLPNSWFSKAPSVPETLLLLTSAEVLRATTHGIAVVLLRLAVMCTISPSSREHKKVERTEKTARSWAQRAVLVASVAGLCMLHPAMGMLVGFCSVCTCAYRSRRRLAEGAHMSGPNGGRMEQAVCDRLAYTHLTVLYFWWTLLSLPPFVAWVQVLVDHRAHHTYYPSTLDRALALPATVHALVHVARFHNDACGATATSHSSGSLLRVATNTGLVSVACLALAGVLIGRGGADDMDLSFIIAPLASGVLMVDILFVV